LPAGQLSVEKFAFDFQSHEQEKHCHQGVIDPVRKAERPDIEMQRLEIGVRKRRVRHDQRERCRRHETYAASGFAIQETPHDRYGTAFVWAMVHWFPLPVLVVLLFALFRKRAAGSRRTKIAV
jgi:hypothetical protein